MCQLRSLILKQLCPLYSNGYSRYADRLRSALPPSGSCDIATIAKLQRHTAPAKPLHQFTCIHCKNRPSGIHTATLSRCGSRKVDLQLYIFISFHSFFRKFKPFAVSPCFYQLDITPYYEKPPQQPDIANSRSHDINQKFERQI